MIFEQTIISATIEMAPGHLTSVVPQRERSSSTASTFVCPSTTQSPAENIDSEMLDNGHAQTSSGVGPDFEMSSNSIDLITAPAKRIIKAISEIQFLPLGDIIQFPNIVVVGDQSAGKSSLIEAITQITVPRDTGTCTRVSTTTIGNQKLVANTTQCPIHVSLTEAEQGKQWSCNVSIVKLYEYQHDARGGPFGPWVQKSERTSIFFANVQRKEEVEHLLRRAQMAVLNPTKDPLSFMSTDLSLCSPSQEFSPNVVRLDISGPGLLNLSFVDLPGIISITKVRQMSRRSISR